MPVGRGQASWDIEHERYLQPPNIALQRKKGNRQAVKIEEINVEISIMQSEEDNSTRKEDIQMKEKAASYTQQGEVSHVKR
ncbi:hypothetical protein ACFX2I_047212 [Malus domestica]